jgi:hypothetical protein
MTGDVAPGGQIQGAIKRVDRAVALLEQRLAMRLAEAGAQAGGLLAQDRAQLAADLDAARSRQRDLEEAGAQASEALGQVAAKISAALRSRGP